MATTNNPKASDVIYDCIVYDTGDVGYGQYLKNKADYDASVERFVAWKESDSYLPQEDVTIPEEPTIKNALEGLRIMNVSVHEESRMTASPIETGVQVSDCKVIMPRRISIKGICDNLRDNLTGGGSDYQIGANGELIGNTLGEIVSKYSKGILAGVGDVIDRFTTHTMETQQVLKTRALAVYGRIHKMYMESEQKSSNPKTYTISTKGAVYDNMILESVEQLNDAEHLLVIPVTLNFKQLIIVGQDKNNPVTLNDQDGNLKFIGSQQKGSFLEGLVQTVADYTGINVTGW